MRKKTRLIVTFAFLPLIPGPAIWIYHSVAMGLYLIRYGEDTLDSFNHLWMILDLSINIVLYLLSLPFVIYADVLGEKRVVNKSALWFLIAFLCPFLLLGLRFVTQMRLVHSILLQTIPATVLLLLPIYWLYEFWNKK